MSEKRIRSQEKDEINRQLGENYRVRFLKKIYRREFLSSDQ